MSSSVVSHSLSVQRPVLRRDRVTAPRLSPKEHGAYAILGVPLVTALVITGAGVVPLLISTATVAGFLSHEPFLILAGRRGSRARESSTAAMRALARRLTVAAVCGLTAFILSGTPVRVVLIVCLLAAGIEFCASGGGFHRALWVQMLGIGSLTLPAAAMLLAAGVEQAAALQFWLIWVTGRVATTASVRTIIVRHKSHVPLTTRVFHIGLLSTATVVCAAGLSTGNQLWVVVVPMLLAAWGLFVTAPHPRHLKRTGWVLLAVNVICGLLMAGLWNLQAVVRSTDLFLTR